jgi:hypothetical protein
MRQTRLYLQGNVIPVCFEQSPLPPHAYNARCYAIMSLLLT